MIGICEKISSSRPIRTVLMVLVEGKTMGQAGRRCAFKDSAAMNLKRRIAADLVAFFGEGVIRQLLDGMKPRWNPGLRAPRVRHRYRTAGGPEKGGGERP